MNPTTISNQPIGNVDIGYRGAVTTPSSLLAPAAATDPSTMMAVLQLQSLHESSKASEKSREAYAASEEASDKARIDEMFSKANETLAFGVVAASVTAFQGTAGIVSAKSSASPKTWGAIAGTAEGTVKVIDTMKSVNITNKDAHIAEHENAAKASKRAGERLDREIDASGQSERKVRELLAEILKSKEQCERAAILRA